MPVALAPADAPNEDEFVLGDVAAELEMEPRIEEDEEEDA